MGGGGTADAWCCSHGATAADRSSRGSEPVPVLHPNLPALYGRRVEALEAALADPATAMAATEALRGLIDAILVFPGERRGEVTVSLRGDLAASLHAASEPEAGHGTTKKAANLAVGGLGRDVMASLDAGTRIGFCRTTLQSPLRRTTLWVLGRPASPQR